MSSSTSFTSKKFNRLFRREDTIQGLPYHTYLLSDEVCALISLTSLYKKKRITRDKLLGQLKALREGTLTRYKKTYHCKITGSWYNEAPFVEILEGLCNSSRLPEVSYNDLIEVISLFANKGYNYSINYIVSSIVLPCFNRWSRVENNNAVFGTGNYAGGYFQTNLIDFPEIEKVEYRESNCCCCGCCCSSYISYEVEDNAKEKIINYFHNYKKGNLSKIPKTWPPHIF